MLKIQEIREIIKLIDQSSIEKFTYESEGTKVVLKKGSSQPVIVQPQEVHVPVQQPVAVVEPKQIVETSTIQPAAETTVSSGQVNEVDPSLHQITSPMVGTFYAASSPEADDFVQVGAKVQQETVVCIVEAMKLFNEIEAEVSGEIVEILVKDGQLVEYGQPLFLVKTN